MCARGMILVIASPGESYQAMQQAWLDSFHRQNVPGVGLAFLVAKSSSMVRQVPGVDWIEGDDVSDTLIPGILDKTRAGLEFVKTRHPGSWVFRSNLSSHVDIALMAERMSRLSGLEVLGYSPLRNHLCGAGIGMTSEVVDMLLARWPQLDRTLIDDVAISQLLMRECRVHWGSRLDRVWPDGLQQHGPAPYYHVRVKTQNRHRDALVLGMLAEQGIALALSWFQYSSGR